jgi:hypothetical protein
VQSLRVGPGRLDVLAALAGLLFLVSVGCQVHRALSKPENSWYAGRAGAESVRTMAWRYAVGGDPFPKDLPDKDVANIYLARLTGILAELRDLDFASTAPDDSELTRGMKDLRAAPFLDRRAADKRDRIQNQIIWYATKASSHDKAARLWLQLSALASLAGVVAAGLRMFGVIDIDLLGVAAACASAAIAWNQLNQNRNLMSAYRITARELTIIRDQIDHLIEAEWPSFVSNSEEAVSREHTLWLARHGHPGLHTR